jgi:hypothetical protein
MNKLFKQNNIILCLLIVILFICIYYFINRNNIENYQEGPTQAPTTTGAATNSDLSNTNGYVKFTTYNDYIKDTNNINIVFNYKYLQTLTDFFTNNNDVNIIINNITYPITYSDSGNGIIYNANDINTNTVYEGILKIKTPTTGGGTTPTTGGGTTPTTGGGPTPTTGGGTTPTTGGGTTPTTGGGTTPTTGGGPTPTTGGGPTPTTGAATNSDLSNTNGYVNFTTYNDYIKDTNNINISFYYKSLQTLTDFFTNNNDVNIIINNITYPITYSDNDNGNGIIYNANDINTNTVYEGILKIKTPTTGAATTTTGAATTTTGAATPTTGGGTTPTTGGGTTPTTGGGTTPTTGGGTTPTTGTSSTTNTTGAATTTTETGVSATTTIPKTTQKSITNNYDDYNIGMMLKGSNNTKNLNDFIAKNTLLGNNIYISPMNQLGVGSDNNEDDIFHKNKHKKIIDSTFTPMIQLG